MAKKSFLIDVEKCSSCSLCVVACKDEYVGNSYAPWTVPQPDTGHFWINVLQVERGKTPRVKMSYLPLLCQHCENAPCIKACPSGAIKRRDDGLVWIDPAACNGCGLCQEACPYDVIYMNDGLGVAQKCTGCAHRIDEGLQPRCVEVCPHDAIVFGDETGAAFKGKGETGKLEVYHPEFETEPRVFWRGLPKPWIAGLVIDAGTDEVIAGAAVTSTDLADNRAVTVRSDEFGDFWIRNARKDRKYMVEVGKEGYANFRVVVTTDKEKDLGTIGLSKAG